MSYILDALKKAESERKMGGVPDLHAQPVSSAAQAQRPPGLGRALAIGAAVVALAAIALAWTKPWQAGRAEPQVTAPAAAPVQVVVAPQPQPAAPVPPPPVPVAIQPPPPAPVAAPIQAPAPAPAAAPIQPPAVAGKPAAEQKPLPKPAEPKLAKATPQAAAAPAQPAEARIPEFGELPDTVRREIPAFAFGGYLYANNAADRTVLVNNRLLHEGDQIAPGLTLEKMMPKEAVLNYQGIRYRMAY